MKWWLLDMNANRENRNVPDYTLLSLAASGGYVKIITLLPSHGGQLKFVELILSCGAAVEVKNKKRKSPLWIAANGGHLVVVEVLCNAGEDIDSQDKIAKCPA
ncbi:hypothetical protein pipiens_007187 [Culex pipiens pipiens]|uniref:ANK_REP_REGION domain-containing protein n=1 Tax=Culex pipiens pipiens TaxID=38569 RepID=A0ABD1DLV3_CULPP